MKLAVRCGVWVVSAISACAISCGANVPRDFALQAHVAPGGGPGEFNVSNNAQAEKLPKPWDLKLNASGHGRTIVFHTMLRPDALDMREVRQKISISAQQLLKLVAAIDGAKFFSLPADLCSKPLEHSGGVSLKITTNGRTHDVSMCAWAMRRDERSAKQLGKIWRVLLSEWRSPNSNKELRWFREKSGSLTD